MFNVMLAITSRFHDFLAVGEPEPMFLPPVENAMHYMPVVTHVESPLRSISKQSDFVEREGLGMCGVGPIRPGSVGAVARTLEFRGEFIVSTVWREPGGGEGVVFASEGKGFAGVGAAVAGGGHIRGICGCLFLMIVLMIMMVLMGVVVHVHVFMFGVRGHFMLVMAVAVDGLRISAKHGNDSGKSEDEDQNVLYNGEKGTTGFQMLGEVGHGGLFFIVRVPAKLSEH